MTEQTNAQAAAVTPVLALVKKPTTAADYKVNAEFYHARALAATDLYNEALEAYQRIVALENVTPGVVVTFVEGKGDKAETLSGQVITKLESGAYQVLVTYIGAPAKLSTVKPVDIVNIQQPAAAEVVEQPAPTPEFDADTYGGTAA